MNLFNQMVPRETQRSEIVKVNVNRFRRKVSLLISWAQ